MMGVGEAGDGIFSFGVSATANVICVHTVFVGIGIEVTHSRSITGVSVLVVECEFAKVKEVRYTGIKAVPHNNVNISACSEAGKMRNIITGLVIRIPGGKGF